jgi:hypothetical protein
LADFAAHLCDGCFLCGQDGVVDAIESLLEVAEVFVAAVDGADLPALLIEVASDDGLSLFVPV